MSRLEKTAWQSEPVPIDILGSVNLPDFCGPHLADFLQEDDQISPTLSVDSGHSTSTDLWPSPRYLLHGGPGFSIALFDSSVGSVHQLPIPVPMTPSLEPNHDHFSLSKVTSLALVGESQVWAGTENGSLHVLDLTPEMRFSGHSYTNLLDPVSCIFCCSGSVPSKTDKSKAEIIVGCLNGNLTIIKGEMNERRGLKNALRCPRKLVQLGGVENSGNIYISCVTMVTCAGVDMCWCGCGVYIIILQCSDWKEVMRLDVCEQVSSPPEHLAPTVHVSHLLATEGGVWTTMAHSSNLTLWDKDKLTPRIRINCCTSFSTSGWLVDNTAQISAINYSYPLIFVGTQGGHLIAFKIQDRAGSTHSSPLTPIQPSQSHPQSPRLTQRLVAGTHCGSNPVINIYTIPLHSESGLASPSPAFNVLVVCGSNGSLTQSSTGQVFLYELFSSPHQSPLTSPMNISGRLSTLSSVSVTSESSSLTLRKLSVDVCGSLPPISLAGASLTSATFLPLTD